MDALKEDMTEQEMFIQKTILLGKPAIATAVQLQKEYNCLEQKTRKEMDMRIKDLLEHREKISTNNLRVRTLVRRDVGSSLSFIFEFRMILLFLCL